ncbi:hypothetical protein ES703_45034 [subsurface metagenome]
MIYIVKHEAAINAKDEDDARRTYVELWKTSWYCHEVLTVEEDHEGNEA